MKKSKKARLDTLSKLIEILIDKLTSIVIEEGEPYVEYKIPINSNKTYTNFSEKYTESDEKPSVLDFSNHEDALPYNVYISKSPIHGNGLFSNVIFLAKDSSIVISHHVGCDIDNLGNIIRASDKKNWKREPAGAFINHSFTPNCYLELNDTTGEVWLKAKYDILTHEELTVDYTKYPCGKKLSIKY